MQLTAPAEPQLINIVIGISIKVQSDGERTRRAPQPFVFVRARILAILRGLDAGVTMLMLQVCASTISPDPVQFLWRGCHVQFACEGGNLFYRKRSQKGLQQYLGFAHAGIEVVVMAGQNLPAVVRMNGERC